ncbi:MAG TPA: YndJ family protein [Candidatus Acidoferrales bacterium]|nr:YndJ family protein [Candidatus Acidoferrales bacterium]
MSKKVTAGFCAWMVLIAVQEEWSTDLTYIAMLVLFAVFVIVPLGVELTALLEKGTEPSRTERLGRASWFPAALAAAASFLFEAGPIAGGLAAVWFAFCVVWGFAGFLRLFRGGWRELDRACPAVAFLSLPIGGAWLVASRLRLTPLGFHEPIVLLTAAHFHYAGFAAAMLVRPVARLLASRESQGPGARIFRAIAIGVLVGPAVLAGAFLFGPKWKVVAASWLAVSEAGLAIAFLAALPRVREGGAKFLVGLAAVCVGIAMVYAMIWAIGEYPLQAFVGIERMAQIHGAINAFGFAFCGLTGWAMAARAKREVATTEG